MEELNIHDLEELAKAGISITFDRYGMLARKYGLNDTGELIVENHRIGYEMLYSINTTIREIIDVAFSAKVGG